MKKNNKYFTAALLLVILPIYLNAQTFNKAGTTSAQFLKIPVGAKAVGMANTFASIADDATTLYWNPAGAASLNKFEINISHNKWIADITHNFLGIVLPIGERSAVGFSAVSLSSGKIERTTIEQPKGTGTFFEATDLAIGVSYSQYLVDQVSVGINAKYVQQKIWNESAGTFALDFGVLLNTGFHGITLGLAFNNFGPEMKLSGSDLIRTIDQDPNSVSNPLIESELKTEPYNLPTSYRASLSIPLVGKAASFEFVNSNFVLAVDALHTNDNPEHYSIGGEYGFSNLFFLRFGYVFNTDEEGLTLGSGLKIDMGSNTFYFDYAYASFGVFSSVQMFSVGIKL